MSNGNIQNDKVTNLDIKSISAGFELLVLGHLDRHKVGVVNGGIPVTTLPALTPVPVTAAPRGGGGVGGGVAGVQGVNVLVLGQQGGQVGLGVGLHLNHWTNKYYNDHLLNILDRRVYQYMYTLT